MSIRTAYHGYLNAGPIHAHLRELEKHDNGAVPFAYSFDDPAVERAYNCAQMHLDLMQGEWFDRQYLEAYRKGLL